MDPQTAIRKNTDALPVFVENLPADSLVRCLAAYPPWRG